MKNLFIALIAITFTFGTQLFAQSLKFPAASPLAISKQAVGISDITVEYSRPSVNGRVIFGEVVPFGQFWRTGANAPTKFTIESDAVINGAKVPAGTYSLFTYPTESEWTIVLNKNLSARSEADHDKANDVANFKVKPTKLNDLVEVFTIDFSSISTSKATVTLKWANTAVSFDVRFDYDAQLTASIEKSMATDSRPFYQAARYYYDNNKDLAKALVWVNKAAEANPSAYWVAMLKAKIQIGLKDTKGATATLESIKKMPGVDKSIEQQVNELLKSIK